MAGNKVNRENYIHVAGWMIKDLKLKGNELLIYACIYGFTQTENQVYNGGLQYLADWTNTSKQSVLNNLNSLIEKDLIVKNEKYINGVKFCEYYSKNLNSVLKNFEQPIQKSLTGDIQKSLTNNIEVNNKVNNKSIFIKPTVEEIQAYCKERNNGVDAQRFFDYYEAKGWLIGKSKMKDWKASVRLWERNTTQETYSSFDADDFFNHAVQKSKEKMRGNKK